MRGPLYPYGCGGCSRQEVEGVFQYILQKQIPVQDIQLVVLNPKYYYHIHQIAKRYNIPVSGKHFTMPSLYIQKLVSAISFIQNPTRNIGNYVIADMALL